MSGTKLNSRRIAEKNTNTAPNQKYRAILSWLFKAYLAQGIKQINKAMASKISMRLSSVIISDS